MIVFDLAYISTIHTCPTCKARHCFDYDETTYIYKCRKCEEKITFTCSMPNLQAIPRVCKGKYKICRHVIKYDRPYIYCNSKNVILQNENTLFCYDCKHSSDNCIV